MIPNGALRVARRFLLAQSFDLAHYRLEGLTTGQPVTLYHGTTKMFQRFDLKKSRDELVNDFYGPGIFLSPSKRVAERYAEANRNIGFDPDIIDDMKRKNPNAGAFLQSLFDKGNDAWDIMFESLDSPYPGDALQEHLKGVDPNTLSDIASYILGSKVTPLGGGPDALDMFSTRSGAPSYVYDQIDELGLDSKAYRPKVYTVAVKATNPLVTANAGQARNAKKKGFDCVVYHGTRLVDGVPEVAVFDPRLVTIKSIEVV